MPTFTFLTTLRSALLPLILAALITACAAAPASTPATLNSVTATAAMRSVLRALQASPGGTCTIGAQDAQGATVSVSGTYTISPTEVRVDSPLPLNAVNCSARNAGRQVALTFSAAPLPITAGKAVQTAQDQVDAVLTRLLALGGTVQGCSVDRNASGAPVIVLTTSSGTAQLPALLGTRFSECWQTQNSTGAAVVLDHSGMTVVSGAER